MKLKFYKRLYKKANKIKNEKIRNDIHWTLMGVYLHKKKLNIPNRDVSNFVNRAIKKGRI